MKVLLLHNKQLSRGGADIVIERETDALVRRGIDVEVLTCDNRDVSEIGRLRSGLHALWNREMERQLERICARFEPDLVHVHTPFPIMSPAVFWTAHRLGLPTVTTMHAFRYVCARGTLERSGTLCTECVGRWLKIPAVVHRCYHGAALPSAAVAGGLTVHKAAGTFSRKVDRFLVLTEYAQRILELDGIPTGKIRVKPNFVPDRGMGDGGGRYALFAGRLAPEKGVAWLLAAREHLPVDVRIKVAGDGQMRADVEAACGSARSMEWLGWLADEELSEQMKRAAVVMLPSEWPEGLALTALESLSVGTPIIVSDRVILPNELRDHPAVKIVAVGDAAALAQQIESFARSNDPATRVAAREHFLRRHTEETVMETLVTTYKQLIDARRHDAKVR